MKIQCTNVAVMNANNANQQINNDKQEATQQSEIWCGIIGLWINKETLGTRSKVGQRSCIHDPGWGLHCFQINQFGPAF